MNHRTNQTLRPSLIDTEGDLDKAMIEGTKNIRINKVRMASVIILEILKIACLLTKYFIFLVADNIMTYTVFLEIAPPDSPLSSLPSFDKDQVRYTESLVYFRNMIRN